MDSRPRPSGQTEAAVTLLTWMESNSGFTLWGVILSPCSSRGPAWPKFCSELSVDQKLFISCVPTIGFDGANVPDPAETSLRLPTGTETASGLSEAQFIALGNLTEVSLEWAVVAQGSVSF